MFRGPLTILLLAVAPHAMAMKFKTSVRNSLGMVRINDNEDNHFREASGLALRGHKDELWARLCHEKGTDCTVEKQHFVNNVLGEGARYHKVVVDKLLYDNREEVNHFFHSTFANGYAKAYLESLENFSEAYWEQLDLDRDGVLQKEELDEACTVLGGKPNSDEENDESAVMDALKFMCSSCSVDLEKDKDYQVTFMKFREHSNKCGF